MPGKKIAILVHETTGPADLKTYRLFRCASIWQAMGFDVEVVRGPQRPQRADLLIPQVDLSVLPGDYRTILDAFPVVMNRRVLDIRKSAFSPNLLRRGDSYPGPVIVKTDANFGGIPEVRAQSHRVKGLP